MKYKLLGVPTHGKKNRQRVGIEKFGIEKFGIGIDKFEVKLTKWNWNWQNGIDPMSDSYTSLLNYRCDWRANQTAIYTAYSIDM